LTVRDAQKEKSSGLGRAMLERFLIVDDHPLFREALQNAIHLAFPFAHILEASSIDGAEKILETEDSVDLLLLDLSMPGTHGFEGLLTLRRQRPRLPVVVVSGLEDSRIVAEALACGVAGFIPKSVRKPELASAIRDIMSGMVYVPEWYAPDVAPPANDTIGVAARLKTLTPQQLRVLEMLRQGKLNKQIAHELSVGETTVKAHITEIFRKLNVHSRTMAAMQLAKVDFAAILADAGVADKRARSAPDP
jgi:DNA-binding NarL/FixJ family response regulator